MYAARRPLMRNEFSQQLKYKHTYTSEIHGGSCARRTFIFIREVTGHQDNSFELMILPMTIGSSSFSRLIKREVETCYSQQRGCNFSFVEVNIQIHKACSKMTCCKLVDYISLQYNPLKKLKSIIKRT